MITVTTNKHGFTAGDTTDVPMLGVEKNEEPKWCRYIVTSVESETSFSIRACIWYENVWFAFRDWCRAVWRATLELYDEARGYGE